MVWHGQCSGDQVCELCENLQRESRSSIAITATTAFPDAVFQVCLNQLFPTPQEQPFALAAFIVLPAETRSKVTYCIGYSVFSW